MSDTLTRREVGRSLLAAAFALAAPGALARPRAVLYDFAVAGGRYHGLGAVAAQVAVGERWALRAEPGNPYDADAVAVLRGPDGPKLGYLPRAANAPVARLLARGAVLEAEVVGRLDGARGDGIPEDLVFTGFVDGDPRLRLTLLG